MSGLLRVFLRAVETTIRRRSPDAPPDARFAAVAFVHRFGSYLNSHVHFHVLLNNAGIFPERGGFVAADPAEVLRVYDVNTVGPLRVTQALLPNLRRGDRKLVMNMSSGLGSIANNGRGSSVGYRSSKAALNMQTRTVAMELADEGFIVVAMSPGWVRTDMGGERAPLGPEESVRGMLGTLAPLTAADSGGYLNHDGSGLPW